MTTMFIASRSDAATFDESNREEAKSIDDCRRTCASILRCAGRLTSKSVEGLASQITMKLASFDHDENIEFKNVAPLVALLCMWGLTEDVSKSLAMSILRAFDDDDGISHTFLIPGSLYIPDSPARLFSPQHWAQEAKDQSPMPRGTWCATYEDAIVIQWDQ